VLDRRHEVGRGRVDHQDAALGGRSHIHVVDTDTGAADDLESLSRRQQRSVDRGHTAHDQGVEVGNELGQPGALLLGEQVDLGTRLLEDLEPGRMQRISDQDSIHD
jgi:hypothetical protein